VSGGIDALDGLAEGVAARVKARARRRGFEGKAEN